MPGFSQTPYHFLLLTEKHGAFGFLYVIIQVWSTYGVQRKRKEWESFLITFTSIHTLVYVSIVSIIIKFSTGWYLFLHRMYEMWKLQPSKNTREYCMTHASMTIYDYLCAQVYLGGKQHQSFITQSVEEQNSDSGNELGNENEDERNNARVGCFTVCQFTLWCIWSFSANLDLAFHGWKKDWGIMHKNKETSKAFSCKLHISLCLKRR